MEGEKIYGYNKCKRLMEKIQESHIEYGKNRIFLTGDELGDLFLRNIRDGYYNLSDSLKDYVLSTSKFKWYILLSSSKTKIKFYEKISDKKGIVKFREAKLEDFRPAKIEDEISLLDMDVREESSVNEEEVELTKDSIDDVIYEMLNKENIGAGEEVCLFIENLDWVAKFYEDSKDNDFIKKIKDLDKLKKHLVIISMKDKTIFEENYYEKLDDKELLTISKATTDEIEATVCRLIWKKLNKNLKNLILEDVALGFSNSKTSLREVIRIVNKKLNEYGENLEYDHFKFKTKVEEKVYWDDIVINEGLKNNLIKKIREFKAGNSKEKGILMFGPPGTGKTMIAKAMATEEKLYFMSPKLSELKGEYVGQSAPKVKAMFEEARANEPTLIFLDEVDTLFPTRDSSMDGDSYTKDMVNEFLQQLDGVDTGSQKILVVAATNRDHLIDPAVKSRLGAAIKVDLPSQDEVKEMYNKEFKEDFEDGIIEIKTIGSKNQTEILRKTLGMSGRDIKNISEYIKKDIKYDEFKRVKNKRELIFKEILNRAFYYKKENIKSYIASKGLKVAEGENINKVKLFGQDIEYIKKQLTPYISEITEDKDARNLRKEMKIEKRNGILLYGPPGNGKTELVKNICKENNLIYIGAEGRSFTSINPKECIENIETIFEESMKLANICSDEQGVVLFFDEFDSLVGQSMTSLIRGTVLTKLSNTTNLGIRGEESKVLLVAATNFYEQIDEAVKRPGRFDSHFVLKNPRFRDGLIIVKESLNENNIKCENIELLQRFYLLMRKIDIKTQIKSSDIIPHNMEERYEIKEEEFFEIIEKHKDNTRAIYRELAKHYLCSASSIRTHVKNFHRFLYNNGELEVGKEYILTDEIINKFGEYING